MEIEEFLLRINFFVNSSELGEELINMFRSMFKNKKIISKVVTTFYEKNGEVIRANTTKLKDNNSVYYKLLEGTFESSEFTTYTFSVEKFEGIKKTVNNKLLPRQIAVKVDKNGEILKLIKFDLSYYNNCLCGSKVKYENDNGIISVIKYDTLYDEKSVKIMEEKLGKDNLYTSRNFSYDFDDLNIFEGIENIESVNKKLYMSSLSEQKVYKYVK